MLIDPERDFVVVTNGRHTNDLAKRYMTPKDKLGVWAMGYVLDKYGSEPDDYHTPRIAGASNWVHPHRATFGIKNFRKAVRVWHETLLENGTVFYLPTYTGSGSNPRDVVVNKNGEIYKLHMDGTTAQELAEELFHMMPKDLVVCTAAVAKESWSEGRKVAVRNLHGD